MMTDNEKIFKNIPVERKGKTVLLGDWGEVDGEYNKVVEQFAKDTGIKCKVQSLPSYFNINGGILESMTLAEQRGTTLIRYDCKSGSSRYAKVKKPDETPYGSRPAFCRRDQSLFSAAASLCRRRCLTSSGMGWISPAAASA